MYEKKSPTCEIVTIGTELLLGQILDTNTSYLAEELNRIGVAIRFRTAAGDQLEDIEAVLKQALDRCDVVITTGGLGPTEDDLTRQAVAKVAGVELEFRQDLMDQIEDIFLKAGYKMAENNRRQAFIPRSSKPIPNPVGTAPGFIANVANHSIICLPGVPRELKFLLENQILPWIKDRYNLTHQVILYKVLKLAGMGESKVDALIKDLIIEAQNPEVGLLSSPGEIKIRLTAKANDPDEARALIRPLEKKIRERLGKKIFGEDSDTLEGNVLSLLEQQGLSLAVLETFTGGLAAQKIHGRSSHRLKTSLVIQDIDAIGQWLGENNITADLESAYQLAQATRERFGTSIGLVCLGLVKEKEEGYEVQAHNVVIGEGIEKVFSWTMGGDRAILQQRGAVIALNTLRLALID